MEQLSIGDKVIFIERHSLNVSNIRLQIFPPSGWEDEVRDYYHDHMGRIYYNHVWLKNWVVGYFNPVHPTHPHRGAEIPFNVRCFQRK